MDYLIVIPLPMYPVDSDTFACESAFAEHLLRLKPYTTQYAPNIRLLAPEMPKSVYQANKTHLTHLSHTGDSIRFTPVYPSDVGRARYSVHLMRVWRIIARAVEKSAIVHAGPSSDPFKLFEFIAILCGARTGKQTVFVVDIDGRESAAMAYKTGRLSKKSYLFQKFFYQPFFAQQIKYAVSRCTLVLLKGKALKEHYGRGQANVHNFLDTAFPGEAVIGESDFKEKLATIGHAPFRLVFFGRLVEYKGLLDMIDAVVIARSELGVQVEFSIIGQGAQREQLATKIDATGANDYITLHPPIPYGDQLFHELRKYDALLAAPQTQDTPRSVFDAMANGVYTLGYDIYYYRDLEECSGAVRTSPWRDVRSLAENIVAVASAPELQRQMAKACIDFAQSNSQEQWLARRYEWLKEAIHSRG